MKVGQVCDLPMFARVEKGGSQVYRHDIADTFRHDIAYSLLEAYALEDIIRGGRAPAICAGCGAGEEFGGFVSTMRD